MPARVARVLGAYGGASDDVLWAALFVLAVLVRDSSSIYPRALGAVARAGVLPVLRENMAAYAARHGEEEGAGDGPDEMIMSAAEFMLRVLEPVAVAQRRLRLALLAAGCAALGLGAAAAVVYAAHRSGGSEAGGSGSGKGGGSGAAAAASGASSSRQQPPRAQQPWSGG